MVNIVIMLIGIFAVLFSLVMLWYFIRSIGVMGKRSIWLAILALFVLPFTPNCFLLLAKGSFDTRRKAEDETILLDNFSLFSVCYRRWYCRIYTTK